MSEMYREDYEHMARIVEGEAFDESETHDEQVWNMAIKVAARQIRRAGIDSPWAPTTPTGAGDE